MQNLRGMRKVPFAISHWYLIYLEINVPFNIHCVRLYSKSPQVQQAVGVRAGTVLFHVHSAWKIKLEMICPLPFSDLQLGLFLVLSIPVLRQLSSLCY